MIFGKIIEKNYRAQVYSRADDTGCVFYFSAEDFEGLNRESHEFRSSLGHTLAGSFYYYGEKRSDRIVIFDHGMGGGHRSYMREIEVLARRGYTVFAYDHTGCMQSGGETTNGFAQSLCDLNDAVNEIKSLDEYKEANIAVVGHSWGGFSTLNISALHPEITHIVAMAGFASVDRILKQNFRGLLGGFYRRAAEIEREANPEFSKYSAAESLKKSRAKALIIHSKDDPVVSFAEHFAYLESELSGRGKTEFLSVDGKGHNPNFTEAAVKYKNEFFSALQRKIKKKELDTEEKRKAFVDSFDWRRMTEQDGELWNKIFDFLEDKQ